MIRPFAGMVGAILMAAAACACRPADRAAGSPRRQASADSSATGVDTPLAGMPPVRDWANIYADAGAGMLDSVARRARPLVYVPDSKADSVTVIDPHTYRVVRTFATGRLPQHV